MDSVDISSLCASLTISSKDGPMQVLDGDLMVDAKNRLSLCLVGKILSRKRVNRDAFMRVIGKIWQVKQGMDMESVAGNIFKFNFRDEHDLNRVMAGSPWSFDGALIALEKPVGKGTLDSLNFNLVDFWVQIYQIPLLCMTKDIGRFLGNMIGQVLEVDGGASGECVGKFLRVRIRVNIDQALKRCLQVDVLGDGVETVLILRYERLQSHCFKCGMVSHTTFECVDKEPFPMVNGKAEPPFGLWLRASGFYRGSHYQNQRGIAGSPNLIKDSGWSGKAVDKTVPESMCEGESSKKIRVLVHVPSVNLEQRDLGGEVGSLKMDIVRSQDQGSMSNDIVTQEQGQEATKLEGIVTEKVVINEERLKEKDGEQRDSVVGGISSGPLLVAHENLGSLDNKGYGSIDVSVNGPHLEMDKVRSNFKLSKSESLNGRFFDSCGSGSKFKKVVVRATGFSKRYSGSELKLGISGEKFKVHDGKRKLELVGKGDFVRSKKIRRKKWRYHGSWF
ncbi:hypothetical protein EZV62_005565 [Acer yangbiense]|uniref:DUF4283 domain-containing protein n=1 Tax=Acer yangbiense TaxID=1000413 RepID=A0A5C7IN32_9ROSI|nr:hypothetical protein EZV62_005565 [Acer yangbiense]